MKSGQLGSCYLGGNGVGKDAVEAAKWLRMAADQGDFNGMGGLALSYSAGWGVTPDQVEADKWTQRAFKTCQAAADKGDADAQYALGEKYAYGLGVSKDGVEAANWYRKASPLQLARCGIFYKNKKDYPEAVKLFRLASDAGDAEAQNELG